MTADRELESFGKVPHTPLPDEGAAAKSLSATAPIYTPTPWRLGNGMATAVFGADDAFVCEAYRGMGVRPPHPVRAANAALIVRAVNSHRDLVWVLGHILTFIQPWRPAANPLLETALREAEAILAKAKP